LSHKVADKEFTADDGVIRITGAGMAALAAETLKQGVFFRFRANGWSMSPFIRNDDIVTLVPVKKKLFKIGDVVAYVQPSGGNLAVHRIVGRRRSSYLIKGDNVTEFDEVVRPDAIIGKVFSVKRNGNKAWIGHGPEKVIIALLARFDLLNKSLSSIRRIMNMANRVME